MEIDFSEMVQGLFKSGEKMKAELSARDLEAMHVIIGLSGEAAELLIPHIGDIFAKERENILEELGDIEFYLEKLRSLYNLNKDQDGFSIPVSYKHGAKDACDRIIVIVGNITDIVKKEVIYRKKINTQNLIEQLISLEMLLNVVRLTHSFTKEEVIQGNIDKLGKRYKGLKYSDQAAQDRADKE